MATPRADTATIASGADLWAGRDAPPILPFEVLADGIWTWFTQPEAVQVGGYIYLGTVSSDGRCRAHRLHISNQVVETFDLSGVLEIDDHNNPSVYPFPDGRVAFFYGLHNDTVFRYRIWDGSGAFTSSGSWTTEAQRGASEGPYSYPKPFVFPSDTTAGRVWLFHRRWTDGGGSTRSIAFRTCNTLTNASSTWSAYTDVLLESSARPYVVMCQDGDKLHCAISSAHPNEATFISIRHFYAEMTSGALVWKDSDGATISTPFAVADTTRADDGGDLKRWVSDIAVGSDGHPRILWMRYPNNNGTAIELWHSRWTGSAWVAHKVADDGAGLYSGEPFYHSGAKFKFGDVTSLFAAPPISGVRQVQELSTSDNGATWSQVRALTSGGSAGSPLKARPIKVYGSDGRINVMWWEGTYTSFINYSTAVKAAG